MNRTHNVLISGILYSFVFVIIFAILNLFKKIFCDGKSKFETLSAIIIINYSLLGHDSILSWWLRFKKIVYIHYWDNLPHG